MALSAEQRQGLWRAKLRALARSNLGRDEGTDHIYGWGAALAGGDYWTALIEVDPLRNLGQAVLLSVRADATTVDVIVEDDAGGVARRAQLFDPRPTVWKVVGTTLTEAEPTPLDFVDEPVVDADVRALFDAAGVNLVIEHGEVVGEFAGLEVARVIATADGARVDVGVGAYDQDAFAYLNPGLAPREALDEVVSTVRAHRHRGAAPHPLNRVVRERWLRSELIDRPQDIGLTSLRPIEPVVARDGINDVAPAFALGVDPDDSLVLVACSVGIDLDTVPAALDLAAFHCAERVVVVLPERDHHPLVLAVAERATIPCDIVVADEPWPSLSG